MPEIKDFPALFHSLVAADPAGVAYKIPPLNTGRYAGEYAGFVADYGALKIAQTGRFIAPYIARDTHGSQVYKALAQYLFGTGAKRFLDLGCGSGELLEELKGIPDAELIGVTIHTGEVGFARTRRGLPLVLPYDMRFVDHLFPQQSFDCIIAYASLQFIPHPEREELLGKVCTLLKDGGIFVEVNYKSDAETGIPADVCQLFRREFIIEEHPEVTGEVGSVRVMRKCRHLDGNLVELPDTELQQFASIHKAGHYTLDLPQDYSQYETSISSSCRYEAKHSVKEGNTFERLYFLTAQDRLEINSIWHSAEARQDRPINFTMELGLGKRWSLLHAEGWPIRDYFALRKSTFFFVVRNAQQAIVAYMELYSNGETAIVHSTMADKLSLRQGANKQLFLNAIRFLITKTPTKSFCYGSKASSWVPLRILLKGFRFS
jgi:SAM-dependent methyltransferase